MIQVSNIYSKRSIKINLELKDNNLRINLNPLEMFLALHGSLSIPLDHIVQASTEKRNWDFGAIRSPGMHIPFLLKAGTYYGRLGREFWHATASKVHMVIELMDWDYTRIILTVGKPDVLSERINQAICSIK